MEAHREIGWHIANWWILYILAIVMLAVIGHTLYKRYHLWHLGKGEDRISPLGERIWSFIKIGIVDGIFHRRIFSAFKDSFAAITHLFIFGGCLLLLLGAALDFISHYWIEFMEGGVYLAFSCINDVGGVLIFVGIFLAVIRRYVQKPERLDNKPEDAIALGLMFVIVISGFILEGFRIAAVHSHEVGMALSSWESWGFLGYGFFCAFNNLAPSTQLIWYQILWWLHIILIFGTVIYICLTFSKFTHILAGPINVFFKSLKPTGALEPILDLEEAESFGVSKFENFSWKQLLDLDACTRCGRCQDNCPAYLTGKALSPKNLIQKLKTGLLEYAKNGKQIGESEEEEYSFIGEVISEEEIWDCTTCGACQEHCPVYVEHVGKIIDMRRSLVLEQARMPETAEVALGSIENRGHPWRGTLATREQWMEELEIKPLSESEDKADILFWVGCTEALEDRSRKVAIAMGKILKAAGVNFAVLGSEETCCGEPARRMGNEYLFQMLVEQNIETFKQYGIKKIVTACPHCFNTLKNEYPQFGGNFEVIHHTEFILDLLKQGKLKITKEMDKVVTYQDPCYLGRYNGIFKEPRQILESIEGLTLREMNWKRGNGIEEMVLSDLPEVGGVLSGFIDKEVRLDRSFCCGAGGGKMWMEETGTRINVVRVGHALATKSEAIITACPFCLQMMEDGIKTQGVEETFRAMDLAELVAEVL